MDRADVVEMEVVAAVRGGTPHGDKSQSKDAGAELARASPRMSPTTCAVVVPCDCPQFGEPSVTAPFFSSLTLAPSTPPAPGGSFISGKIAMSRAAFRPPGSTPMTTPMPMKLALFARRLLSARSWS